MSWQTEIARRVFPKEQKFMARRKLRTALWTLAAGITASAMFMVLAWWAGHRQ